MIVYQGHVDQVSQIALTPDGKGAMRRYRMRLVDEGTVLFDGEHHEAVHDYLVQCKALSTRIDLIVRDVGGRLVASIAAEAGKAQVQP